MAWENKKSSRTNASSNLKSSFMTAIYDYNQGIVNFMKFALQWVLIRLSRFYNNNNGNIGSLCVLTFFTICSHSIHRNSFRSRLEKKVEQKKSI